MVPLLKMSKLFTVIRHLLPYSEVLRYIANVISS